MKYDHIHPERGGWLMLVACCGAYDWTKNRRALRLSRSDAGGGGVKGTVQGITLVTGAGFWLVKKTMETEKNWHNFYPNSLSIYVMGHLEVYNSWFNL